MTSASFWDITRRRVVIVCRRFGILTREDGTYTLSRNVGKKLPTTPRTIFTGQESYHLHGTGVLFGLLTREDGTDTLSRNVGKQLPHDVA
jgi:hypothetical protein